jgi:enoyl-CoA hydratase/carnithine racemase
MADGDLVNYERKGRIAYITLSRPDKLNAFNDESVLALRDRLWEFDRDEEAWVAVLRAPIKTGNGVRMGGLVGHGQTACFRRAVG